MTKKLVSRDKQEEIDKALRERKKAMRRLAKSKLRSATGRVGLKFILIVVHSQRYNYRQYKLSRI